ncbi:BlaI/MecI/CopY family transcriptional regulator [Singulisphaera rosea]
MAREDSDPDPLTAAEWKVMKIVWRRKGCASRDVCEEAGREQGWASSTVKTMLRRLVEKGHLSTTQVGNSFLYRPTKPALKAVLGAADALLDNVLEGMTGPLLAHMVKKSKLSAEELARLRALIEEHEPSKED